MSLLTVEYLKIAGYVVSGFVSARVWFAKEIAKGRAVLKAVEQKVVDEVKAVEKKL